jgi:2-dehydropantoate 2-reductase
MGIDLPADCTAKFRAFMANLDPGARSSMAYDLAAGRRLELEALNGTAVRLGREHGVPTPLNAVIYAALKPYVEGTRVSEAKSDQVRTL